MKRPVGICTIYSTIYTSVYLSTVYSDIPESIEPCEQDSSSSGADDLVRFKRKGIWPSLECVHREF